MAKLRKSQLKEIVKECLVEILSEGIGNSNHEMQSALTARKREVDNHRAMNESHARRSVWDHVEVNKAPTENRNFDAAVSSTAESLTSDPIMQSIFEDTARTTLQSQLGESTGQNAAGSISANGDAASVAMLNSDPMQMFGESSSNWAALAFQDGKNSSK